MKLYSYYRSSAVYRVRIALNLKGLPYSIIPTHLSKDGGAQHSDAYKTINPQKIIPSLITDDGQAITQSMAIIEYLEETNPTVALLPQDALGRARVRSISQLIACETHPLNNLRVLKYLKKVLHISDDDKNKWYQHWIHLNFTALESILQAPETGKFCHGNTPSMADCLLVPQVYNARRFDCDLSAYPTIVRIDAECNQLQAFQKAAPEQQEDIE